MNSARQPNPETGSAPFYRVYRVLLDHARSLAASMQTVRQHSLSVLQQISTTLNTDDVSLLCYGSSLHPHTFLPGSDIDLTIVCDDLHRGTALLDRIEDLWRKETGGSPCLDGIVSFLEPFPDPCLSGAVRIGGDPDHFSRIHQYLRNHTIRLRHWRYGFSEHALFRKSDRTEKYVPLKASSRAPLRVVAHLRLITAPGVFRYEDHRWVGSRCAPGMPDWYFPAERAAQGEMILRGIRTALENVERKLSRRAAPDTVRHVISEALGFTEQESREILPVIHDCVTAIAYHFHIVARRLACRFGIDISDIALYPEKTLASRREKVRHSEVFRAYAAWVDDAPEILSALRPYFSCGNEVAFGLASNPATPFDMLAEQRGTAHWLRFQPYLRQKIYGHPSVKALSAPARRDFLSACLAEEPVGKLRRILRKKLQESESC